MSEKRMVYAEDVIQRIRDLAPEILGGWYNPDMENELEQLVCVVENTPTAAADAQRWRYTAEEPPKEEDGDCCGRVLIATPVPIVRSLRPCSTPERTRRLSAFGCRFRNYRGRKRNEHGRNRRSFEHSPRVVPKDFPRRKDHGNPQELSERLPGAAL